MPYRLHNIEAMLDARPHLFTRKKFRVKGFTIERRNVDGKTQWEIMEGTAHRGMRANLERALFSIAEMDATVNLPNDIEILEP